MFAQFVAGLAGNPVRASYTGAYTKFRIPKLVQAADQGTPVMITCRVNDKNNNVYAHSQAAQRSVKREERHQIEQKRSYILSVYAECKRLVYPQRKRAVVTWHHNEVVHCVGRQHDRDLARVADGAAPLPRRVVALALHFRRRSIPHQELHKRSGRIAPVNQRRDNIACATE